jgi:hypothetical protein
VAEGQRINGKRWPVRGSNDVGFAIFGGFHGRHFAGNGNSSDERIVRLVKRKPPPEGGGYNNGL